ncbi:bifunctional L-3-cyanoalanine synthase/cysteine synthase 1, mitochondrial, partial [Tanacetum coccineum]
MEYITKGWIALKDADVVIDYCEPRDKRLIPHFKIYGFEPQDSNVLNGGKAGPHQITRNGVGFKPDILDMDIMQEVLVIEETTLATLRIFAFLG